MTEAAANIGKIEEAVEGPDETQHDGRDPTSTAASTSTSKRNAFVELMASKPPKTAKLSLAQQTNPGFYARHAGRAQNDPRLGLLAYILRPDDFPTSVVVRVTSHTVLIRDMFPKATVHLLLLPRSEQHRNLHPHDAFADQGFLEMVQAEADSAANLAASELSRLISPHSMSCQARNAALGAADPPDELPDGRDFKREFKIGVHAHPSMAHLHVHIISRDMHSERLKHKKHYNSFNTPFFIPLADYPLGTDDKRRSTSFQNDNLKANFACWRCGRDFTNKFQLLKDHLEQEFQIWKQE